MSDYIHCTNSNALRGLKYTRNHVCGVLAMLLEYNFAPMSGELFLGGLKGVVVKMNTAFAPSSYISEYIRYVKYNFAFSRDADTFSRDAEYVSKDLIKQIKALNQNLFFELTSVVVNSLRLKQAGLLKMPNQDELALIAADLEKTQKKLFQRWLYNYIIARFVTFRSYKEYEPESINKLFECLDTCSHLIPENFLELTDEEQLSIVLSIFTEESGYKINDLLKTDVGLDSVEEDDLESELVDFYTLLLEPDRLDFIRHYAYYSTQMFASDKKKQLFVEETLPMVVRAFAVIKNRLLTDFAQVKQLVQLLLAILNPDGQKQFVQYVGAERVDLENPFPVAFMLPEKVAKDKLLDFGFREARAKDSLVFGEDLTNLLIYKKDLPELLRILKDLGIDARVLQIYDLEEMLNNNRLQLIPADIQDAGDRISKETEQLFLYRTERRFAEMSLVEPQIQDAEKAQFILGAPRCFR